MQQRATDEPVEDIDQGLPESKPPAHRPSRRHVIVQAAIKVFAQQGFVHASIQDIAEEAAVVPTAVYYHFSGKDELFEVALSRVIEEIDLVVEKARAAYGSVTGASLSTVIAAVWDWIETHPDEARIIYIHLPGATAQAQALSREFEELHVQRAFDYLSQDEAPPRLRSPAAEHAAATLAVRTLMTLLMSIHPLRLEDGPLSRRSSAGLRKGLDEVSRRIIGVATEPPGPAAG